MAGETTGTATPPPAPSTDPKPAGTPPATPPANAPEGLGEAGLKALQAERSRAEAAEREAAAAKAEAETLRAKNMTESEKAIEAARKEGAQEASTTANRRIVRSEIRAAAAGKVSDPEDAAALLGDLDRFIVKGEVDSKAITEAISELVKVKPYLAPAGRAKPLPGGGATQHSGFSMNDEIRRRIRGG